MSGSPTPPSAAPVAVVMGSSSDLDTMRGAIEVLDRLHIESQARVVSAHRTPLDMVAFAEQAAARGVRVIIAGAGGAAHLPGMLAAVTHLPVIGVPVPLKHLDGMDALLSMAQMPAGVPVATVGVGNSRNAALLAARILALADDDLAERVVALMDEATEMARSQDRDLRDGAAPPVGGS